MELSDFDEEEIVQDAVSPKESYKEESDNTELTEDRTNIENQQLQEQQHLQQPSHLPIVDPFEFQEDPVVFEPSTKPSGSSVKQDPHYVPHYQQQQNASGQSQLAEDSIEEASIEKLDEELEKYEIEESQEESEDKQLSKVSVFHVVLFCLDPYYMNQITVGLSIISIFQ